MKNVVEAISRNSINPHFQFLVRISVYVMNEVTRKLDGPKKIMYCLIN